MCYDAAALQPVLHEAHRSSGGVGASSHRLPVRLKSSQLLFFKKRLTSKQPKTKKEAKKKKRKINSPGLKRSTNNRERDLDQLISTHSNLQEPDWKTRQLTQRGGTSPRVPTAATSEAGARLSPQVHGTASGASLLPVSSRAVCLFIYFSTEAGELDNEWRNRWSNNVCLSLVWSGCSSTNQRGAASQ